MNLELTKKVIRCLIVGFIFISVLTISGMGNREAQQLAFSLVIMAMFGLLIRNIWITLFLGWTVFLFAFFKFQFGNTYVNNVFFGCILYFMTKVAFTKKHIDFFIRGVLWFVFANIVFIIFQELDFDFIYNHASNIVRHTGFMGNIGFVGCLMALAVPLLASRSNKWADMACAGLFVPIWQAQASLCMLMAIIGLLFVLFYRLNRKIWAGIVVVLMIAGLIYAFNGDMQSGAEMRFPHWKLVLKHAVIHPVTGWGLDSFRNAVETKQFQYLATHINNTYTYWDNPHNLYISLFYEFGIVGLFLLCGYLRQMGLWYIKAEKSRNTIARTGFMIVFLGVSMGHFPMFLNRFAVILIPMFALLELQIRDN